MFIDSHCHLNYAELSGDMEGVLKRAADVGIHKMLTICTELKDAQEILDIANAHESIYSSVGVHPHEAKQAVDAGGLYEGLKHYTQFDKVVGLGETGLDYYYHHSPKEDQQQAFSVHIQLAKETGLPLIIHTRDAEQDTIDMLAAEKGNITGVIHCFSGTQWLCDRALELGFYISVSGIVTFKKAEGIREAVKTVPLDRILLETDAPYLAPVPMRGHSNEPSYMIHTAQVVADLKGVSMDELAQVTSNNFATLFNKAS